MLGMPPARFLRDYWQKQPLLIRNACTDFRNPVAPDDLAGLACEELALARIAVHEPKRDRWTLRSGPFAEADFASLPKTHWTLLVQDVDKWDVDVAALLDRFSFLPSWRIDDVMVSYAEDGGSVGAHVDQYDVFLLQGLGRRRWQISTDPAAPLAFRDDAELKLLREFTPTDEWVLEPGDMLYLPPGVPHHGIALGECMSYSVGMRAPSQADLLIDFAETFAETIPETWRLIDPDLAPARSGGEIDDAAIARVMRAMPWLRLPVDITGTESRPASHQSNKKRSLPRYVPLLRHALRAGFAVRFGILPSQSAPCPALQAKEQLRMWFGCFITRYRNAQVVAANPRPLTDATFARALAQDANVRRNPWSRFAWMREARGAKLFVAGESHNCSLRFARFICAQAAFPIGEVPMTASDSPILRALIDAGHLAIVRSRRST